MGKLWTKVWQVAGLEQQIKEPGDFFTFEFGPESILCARGEDKKLDVFTMFANIEVIN